MKIKIIFFVILFVSNFGFSQNYVYHLTTNDNTGGPISYCLRANPGALSNTQKKIRVTDINNNDLRISDAEGILNTRPNQYIVNIGSCRWIEGPNRGGTFNLGGFTITIPSNVDSYYEINTTYNNSSLYFEKINTEQLYELNCSVTSINAANGINDSNIIEWEYSLAGLTSVLNNSAGVSSVPFDFDNFDIDLNQHIGETIFFRYKLVGGLYSPFRAYTIISCSPQLLSFTPSNTQCSYSSDGSFTAIFDRALNTGEELIMLLYKVESDGSEIITSGGQQSTTTLDTGNTYRWPLPQIAGNYLVKYQTKTGSAFSSLESSRQFPIGNPPPITFSATKQNDVYCKGGSDAAIQLTASGGVGGFKYELNNSGTWTPFAASNTHNITGLPKGTKTIKVQDGNGCTQRE